ncbi:hypothetical protein ACI77I_26075 [Pseudomonas sp. D47]|uniref:hypothetical protein n=1 Tax=Pseudomonas sp. D47 TaxID=3159447 RepID=UPI00387AFE42
MDRIYNPDRVDDDRRFSEGDFELGIDATPLAATFLNNLQEEVCAVIEGAGMTLDPANQAQLLTAIEALIKAKGSTQSTLVQTFTKSGTFKKLPGAKSIHVLLIGAGQGGGSGSTCPPDGSALGGAGGTGGARLELTLDAALFPDSCAVIVGMGGFGGAASATAGLPGGGATGTELRIGSCSYRVVGGNTINNTAVFLGGIGGIPSKNYGGWGGNGTGGAPGGGGGGGISDSSAGGGASSVYSLLNATTGSVPGGSNGRTPGGDGMDVPTSGYCDGYKYPGISGGGGGARYDLSGGNGGRGGDGGLYGAGGGGGGATLVGGLSGAGGNGADGVAVITTYF